MTVSLVGQFLDRTFIGVAKTCDKELFALAEEALLGQKNVVGDECSFFEVVDLL